MKPSHRDLLVAYWMLFDEIGEDETNTPKSDDPPASAPKAKARSEKQPG